MGLRKSTQLPASLKTRLTLRSKVPQDFPSTASNLSNLRRCGREGCVGTLRAAPFRFNS